MGLSKEQIELRRKYLGGSDAIAIVKGDWQALFDNKVNKVDPEFDQATRFKMELGTATEPVIRQFFLEDEKDYELQESNYFMVCKEDNFMASNLDSILLRVSTGQFIPHEIKYHTGMKSLEELAQFYYPQLMHNTYVANAPGIMFSVGFGAWAKKANMFVERDDNYIEWYLEQAREFWQHVETGRAPANMATLGEPEKAAIPATKTQCFKESNSWAVLAKQFIDNFGASKLLDEAKDGIKELIPEDVKIAWGHGVIAKKNAKGSVTIKPMTDKEIIKYKKEEKEAA